MLRRKPTTITLTSEDIAAYDDHRAATAAAQQRTENENPTDNDTATAAAAAATAGVKGDGKIDPNDELKPLPGDRPRIRNGVGGSASGLGREERIFERRGGAGVFH